MHRIFRVKAYEAEHGPHFNEEHARKAVSKMENEDGTRGPHWSVLVFLDPTSFTNRQIDNTTTVITSTGAKALLNGSGAQMTNNEITTGNRYLIYYNKCDGIFQVINHIVVPATPAA